MNDEISRDKELDQLLAPLREQELPTSEVDRMISTLLKGNAARRQRWAALAFAAGLFVGIGGTLVLTKQADFDQQSNADQDYNSDEFATVRQVSTK